MLALALFNRVFFGANLLLLLGTVAQAQWWTVQTSGIDTNLRAVSAVYPPDPTGALPAVVWASGSNGVILRSPDAGKSWKRLHVQGGDALDFRGIAALDPTVAYVMSIGPGDKSRIYKTTDGGETWKLQFAGSRKEVFLDAIVCFSNFSTQCFVLGDPVDGRFLLMFTEDGEHWKELPHDTLPAAMPSEGAFAASNSSLCINFDNIYFGTGGAAKARVFHSPDLGKTWTVADTPVASGNASSGIFSISCKIVAGAAFYAVGGDYNDPSRVFRSAAFLHDLFYFPKEPAGWQLSKQQPGGFRSGVAHVDDYSAVAVGPNGEDVTQNSGMTWEHTDSLNLNAVMILDSDNGWAVGPKGIVARFQNKSKRVYEIRNDGPATNEICMSQTAACSTWRGPVH